MQSNSVIKLQFNLRSNYSINIDNISLMMDLKMIKNIFLILITTLSSATFANTKETRTYNQPPVVTGEFEVEQEDQKHLAKLAKDTDTIQVESDFLGIKKFANETFNKKKIKERFDEGVAKLREDESSISTGKLDR